eukprot:jgi/Galph1/1614/GphlegSOOS_G273.1
MHSTSANDAKKKELEWLREIWSFVNQYYYEKSYGGLDWNQVWEKYSTKLLSNKPQQTYQVANEMIGLLHDRYSRLLKPSQFQKLLKYDMTGTGLLLAPSKEGDWLVTGPPMKNSPAAEAGIQVGDRIVAVNGRTLKGLNPLEAATILQDDRNDLVLQVMKDAKEEGKPIFRSITLKRKFSDEKAISTYRVLSYPSTKDKDIPYWRIGYIKIDEFSANLAPKLLEVVNELESQGVNAYVLDLQGNRGGALEGAVQVASIFLDKGIVVRIVDRNHHEEQLTIHPNKRLEAVNPSPTTDPIVILMDRYSASASEILASALHDHCRAVLVGERSYGKGLVQAVFGLSDGSGMVLTVAEYQTPKHIRIHGEGIAPDIPLKRRKPNASVIQWDKIHKQLESCQELE